MNVDTYLTEFAAELRLGVDDERAAELVSEIAVHLDSAGGNPVDEFGKPSVFARELIAAEAPQTGIRRRIAIGIGSGVALTIALFGFNMLLYGSSIPWQSLGIPIAIGVTSGGFVPVVRGRVRDADGSKSILLFFVGLMLFAGLGMYLTGRVSSDAMIQVPAGRWVGAAMIIIGGFVTWKLQRPLRFHSDAPVKSTPWGHVRRVRS